MLNAGQVARIKASRLSAILAEYKLEAVAHDWGTETYHITRGLIRKEGIHFYLKGEFFGQINVEKGVKLNDSLDYDFLESPYIVWAALSPKITDENSFLDSLTKQFIRAANCGFLPGEAVGVKQSPQTVSLARKMFPHLVSQWEGKHHKAFEELFPATYIGCRRVTQGNYKIILNTAPVGEFEIPAQIAKIIR